MNPAVKEFCLRIIHDTYGYGYRADWHADLDDPTIYSHDHRGSLVVEITDGSIVGVGGLRDFKNHQLYHRFKRRYGNTNVGALWRVYVDPAIQRTGVGSRIASQLEVVARGHGYDYLYLHTSQKNSAAVSFWEKNGYQQIVTDDNDDQTVHMEKRLT